MEIPLLTFAHTGSFQDNTISIHSFQINLMSIGTFLNSCSNHLNFPVKKHEGKESTCSLCLENIEHNDEIHELSCDHIFHSRKCLDNKGIADWIAENKTCPNCRAKIDISKSSISESEYQPDNEEIEFIISQSVSRETAIQFLNNHKNTIDSILKCSL